MREIKFRGQDYQRHWHYGSLVIYNNGTFAIAENDPTWTDDGYHNDDFDLITVRPETVGQFTGLKDKNDNEIYEGDIIEGEISFWIEEDERIETLTGAVLFTEGTFVIESDIYANIPIIELNNIQIIGNIFDNPELLKKEEK